MSRIVAGLAVVCAQLRESTHAVTLRRLFTQKVRSENCKVNDLAARLFFGEEKEASCIFLSCFLWRAWKHAFPALSIVSRGVHASGVALLKSGSLTDPNRRAKSRKQRVDVIMTTRVGTKQLFCRY